MAQPKTFNHVTFRFNVIDRSQMGPLFDALDPRQDTLIYGCQVNASHWGNLFAECDAWQRRYEIAKDLLKQHGAWEALETLERLESLFPISKFRKS